MVQRVAIIGLGVIGRRMVTNMTAHEGFEVIGAWDIDAAVRAAAAAEFPGLAIADDADEIIAGSTTDLVYIGVPPLAHKEYALAAIAAGKAVFCEKPLGIDIAESRDLVARMEASGLPQAVNFVYGSAAGGEGIRERLEAGALGGVIGVDIRLHFAKWPRGWQENAAWLSRRDQGGFVREVLSHAVYLSERLFGPARLEWGHVRYPEGAGAAETHVLAQLDCGGVPVSIAGSVGGAGPDLIDYAVWGTAASCRLYDWYKLAQSDGGPWRDCFDPADNLALAAYMAQLDGLADMLAGRPHRLPDFRAALSVQETIEALLAA